MKKRPAPRRTVGLKHVAEYLGLNPATVSVVLNNTPGRSIPEATRERIRAAARELNYQPSLLARSLQSRHTQTIGILVPELDHPYYTQILSGIGAHLMKAGYFYFTAHHGASREVIEHYSRVLLQRGAEGIIAIDTSLECSLTVPVVSIAGQQRLPGIINVAIDYRLAAELLLEHLHSLGHRHIAFVKGPAFGATTDEIWRCILQAARKLGLPIEPTLVFEGERRPSHQSGHPTAQQLLSNARFTALVACNNTSTMAALRGLQDAGLRVPEDVSLVGFEDSGAATFTHPQITTIRSQLCHMGAVAAHYVLDAMSGRTTRRKQIVVKPDLLVRESTASPRS